MLCTPTPIPAPTGGDLDPDDETAEVEINPKEGE
jgi:hypothetical protein